MEHPSDEIIGPTRGTDWSDFGVWRQLHAHTWDPSHAQLINTWNHLNSGIFRASQVVESSAANDQVVAEARSEEHTSELQSRGHLVCRLLLEKKKQDNQYDKTQ